VIDVLRRLVDVTNYDAGIRKITSCPARKVRLGSTAEVQQVAE
jgi:hypothetical protein